MSQPLANTFTVTMPLLNPEQVSVAEFIAFSRELALAIEDESGVEAPPTAKVAARKAAPLLALVGVIRGSTGYEFQPGEPVLTAVRRILDAISSPSAGWSALKDDTRTRVRKAFDRLEKCGSRVELSGPLLGNRVVAYAPPLAARNRENVVKGGTDLSVKVLSVSCTSSRRAYVVPLNGEPAFHAKVETTSLLQRLGGSVEQRVILRGTAEWELPDWHITGFEADDVLDYPTMSPAEVFDALAELLGDRADGIFERYVADRRQISGGEE